MMMPKRALSVSLFVILSLAGCRLERVDPSTKQAQPPLQSDSPGTSQLLGLRTAIYSTTELNTAKAWYAEVTEVTPYFDQPFYVGFNIGGFELGLVPVDSITNQPNTGIAYWGVTNADSAYARLLELGATAHEPIQDVGDGVKIGSVLDPFGNVLGVVENPAFTIQ